MTALATAPGFEFRSETTVNTDLELPQVGDTTGLVVGLTDGTQFAQLSLVLAHPTAGTNTVALTNNFGAAQPEMLVNQNAPIGKHHVRLDLQWTTGVVTLNLDSAAATQATFMKGTGSSIPTTVAIQVTTGANIDDVAVCVPF